MIQKGSRIEKHIHKIHPQINTKIWLSKNWTYDVATVEKRGAPFNTNNTLNIPTVNIPTVNIPTVNIWTANTTTVSIPTVNIPTVKTTCEQYNKNKQTKTHPWHAIRASAVADYYLFYLYIYIYVYIYMYKYKYKYIYMHMA